MDEELRKRAQVPAVGVAQNYRTGDMTQFTVTCQCSDPACAYLVTVYKEHGQIEVDIDCDLILSCQRSGFFQTWFLKLKYLWQLLFGEVKITASIILNEQTAINFCASLEDAVKNAKE